MPDTMTTGEKILAQINLTFEKVVGSGEKQYRGNSPFRADSDSKGFTLVVSDCGEKGAYIDHARDNERGSLYDLAKRLGIEPTPHEVGTSKRPYKDMVDYAQQHGIDAAILMAAGWAEGVYQGRKCIIIATATGKRYRFLDGDKPSYKSELNYQRCWFGLDRAIGKHPTVLVLCNGEVSTLVAQHFGVPAFAMTGGESRLPDNLLDELKRKWKGTLYIALDCDKPGRDAAARIHEQLPDATLIDLNLSIGGDLADFCKLYTTDSFSELQRRAGVKVEPQPLTDDAMSESFQTLAVVSCNEFVGLQSGKIQRLGLQSRIPDLDLAVGTFMPSRIHLVLGATGMGKSTLGVSLAMAFMWQAPGLVVSTETPPKLWIAKCAAMKANLPVDRILEGTATNTEVAAVRSAYQTLSKLPVRVFNTISPDIGDIEDWVKRWVKPLGAKWLLIDSISRVIAKGKHNIFDKTTEVSNRLQSLTLETGLSVVTTSQVGRHLRDRANKIPTIQDGYGSGALEQDADVVMSLYYHDYYVRQGLADANDQLPPGKAFVQVGKHRWRNVDNQQVFLHFKGGIGFYPWSFNRPVIAPPLLRVNDLDMWS
jgi:KaiC/GvpD/RAD55 family RecA-like ATPase